jgi:hypothetical protein
MAIPAAITPITVSGQFVKPDGSAAVGLVSFTPSITATTDGVLLPVSPLSVSLDAAGSFAVVLAATDDPQWDASGFTYAVSERIIGGQPRSYNIEVPAASPGGALDLADAATRVADAGRPDRRTWPSATRSVTSPRTARLGDSTADDTAAVQAAIDALPTRRRGRVLPDRHVQDLTAALTLASGVTLAGSGDDTIVIINQTSTSASCVTGSGVEKVGLRNLQLQGPGSGTGHGLSLVKGAALAHRLRGAGERHRLRLRRRRGQASRTRSSATLSRVISTSNGGYGFNLSTGRTAGPRAPARSLSGLLRQRQHHGGVPPLQHGLHRLERLRRRRQPDRLPGRQQSVGDGLRLRRRVEHDRGVQGDRRVRQHPGRRLGLRQQAASASGSLARPAPCLSSAPSTTARTARRPTFIKVDTGSHVALLNCNNTTANSLASGHHQHGHRRDRRRHVPGLRRAGRVAARSTTDLTCYVAAQGHRADRPQRRHQARTGSRTTNGTLGTEQVS